jgi:hypothetical protein
MRPALSFFSVLAAGLLIAAVMAVIGSGPASQYPNVAFHEGRGLSIDYPSLIIGLVLGVALTFAGRLTWADLPRRFVHWLINNERNFYRAGMAAVLLVILVFY